MAAFTTAPPPTCMDTLLGNACYDEARLAAERMQAYTACMGVSASSNRASPAYSLNSATTGEASSSACASLDSSTHNGAVAANAAEETAEATTLQQPVVSQASESSSVHLLIKHGAPWRGSYTRLLRISPKELATLSSSKEVTNRWRWDQVLGARPVRGRPREFVIHVAQDLFAAAATPPSPTTAGPSPPQQQLEGKRPSLSIESIAAKVAASRPATPMTDDMSLAAEPIACLAQPWEAMTSAIGESLRTLAWGHSLRFEAADEATATRLITEVRRAAERGLHSVV